jgi:protease II
MQLHCELQPDPTVNFNHACRYGAYGYPYEADFSRDDLSLIDRGWIVATAHVRGGGEMGRQWYEDGKYMHKKNSFTDFISCAEHLIKVRGGCNLLFVTGAVRGSVCRLSFAITCEWRRGVGRHW